MHRPPQEAVLLLPIFPVDARSFWAIEKQVRAEITKEAFRRSPKEKVVFQKIQKKVLLTERYEPKKP
jgi:hypothetical protein